MPIKSISVDVDVRDDAEAAKVKTSLEHILSLNGATGVLNLYEELTNNVMIRTAVKAVAGKFRKQPRS